jgi:hypothetical protein
MPDEIEHDGPADDEEEDDFDSLPGRPIGPDEIDPELIKLARSRPSVGAITAVAIVAFCGFLMITLRGDLTYSRAGGSPTDTSLKSIVDGDVGDESYVRLEAMPDRTLAVRIATSDGDTGSRATPVWGSDGKVWIVVSGSTWAALATEGVYEGRLKSLDALPYGSALRSHVSKLAIAPRYVTANAVRAALKHGGDFVLQPDGDRIEVVADTRVDIEETRLDRTTIRVFATTRHPTADKWTEALAAAGIIAADTKAIEGVDEDTWSYDVDTGVDEVRTKLDAAKLTAARAKPVVDRRQAVWGDLAKDGTLSGDNVQWVALHVPRDIPDDAMVLLTNEQPGSYWYLLPLYGILAVFVGLFIWALVRAIKPDSQDVPAAAV